MMLRYMNLPEYADRIEKAVFDAIADGKLFILPIFNFIEMFFFSISSFD